MQVSKAFLRSIDFAANFEIRKMPAHKPRKSRKLAEITISGRYPDGTPFNLTREARSTVHKCR